jgi:putative transposase
MPSTTLLEIPPEEQAQMRAILRRARYGYLLAFHILLLCAAGRTPTEIATFLFCSRSSVYRIVRAYRMGHLGIRVDQDGRLSVAVQTSILMPWLTRSLGALLKAAPRAYGWCRTRWSCATLAATLHTKHGIEVSAETVRRWLHEMDWVWNRAKLVAKDDDPHRVQRVARLRFHHENLHAHEVMVFADERDIHLLPKVGAAWMPQGTQETIMTPGKNEKHYLAGALPLATGKILYCLGSRKNNGLFRDLLTLLDATYPARQITRIYVVVDNYCIHKAKAVEQWLASHPRCELLWLPTYCPRANPIERAFGDVHDKCTRNHKRKRLRDLVQDVERHVQENGPWQYKLSQLYDTPEITAAVEHIAAEKQPQLAA